VLLAAATPAPGPDASASALAGARAKGEAGAGAISATDGRRYGKGRGRSAIVAQPSSTQQHVDATRFVAQTETHIATRWLEGFYPIYATAQSTFGVSWLLIASIHRQESAFSTASTTYHGLNFAGCCGGPMQFNVTNGPVTTWRLVSDSYRYGSRPAAYDHVTARHPSIYDDFDAIMAAAHLLSANGAGYALDATAWAAAYAYYGHDAAGVTYADQVLARAIGWSQHGFCINCGIDTALIEAVHAAYGEPVLAALVKASTARLK
jgi:lysozyme family protein